MLCSIAQLLCGKMCVARAARLSVLALRHGIVASQHLKGSLKSLFQPCTCYDFVRVQGDFEVLDTAVVLNLCKLILCKLLLDGFLVLLCLLHECLG